MSDVIVDVLALRESFDRYREVQKALLITDNGEALRVELDSLRVEVKSHLVRREYERGFLSRFYVSLKNLPVLLVCYADPPYARSVSKRDELITQPHSWASNAVDYAVWNMEENSTGVVINAAWDDVGGLVIVLRTTFANMIEQHYNRSSRYACNTSICAHIEYYVRSPTRREQVSSEVVLTGFEFMNQAGGCNPGGMLYVPDAPRFSLMLRQLRHEQHISGEYDERRAHSRREIETCTQQFVSAPKMNQARARALFPNQSWGNNRLLDLLVEGSCVKVGDEVTFKKKKGW